MMQKSVRLLLASALLLPVVGMTGCGADQSAEIVEEDDREAEMEAARQLSQGYEGPERRQR